MLMVRSAKPQQVILGYKIYIIDLLHDVFKLFKSYVNNNGNKDIVMKRKQW